MCAATTQAARHRPSPPPAHEPLLRQGKASAHGVGECAALLPVSSDGRPAPNVGQAVELRLAFAECKNTQSPA